MRCSSRLGAKVARLEKANTQINDQMICSEAHEDGVSVEQQVVTISARLWNAGEDSEIV